jgi:hypothetical protein
MRAMAAGRMLGAGSAVRANPATRPAKKIAPEGARGEPGADGERGRRRLDSQILWFQLYPSRHAGVIQDANRCFAYLVDNIAG